jgi:hypothetical protein
MKHVALPIALACFLMTAPAAAEEVQSFPKDQIATGAELYAVNCSRVTARACRSPARHSICGNFRPTSANASSIR